MLPSVLNNCQTSWANSKVLPRSIDSVVRLPEVGHNVFIVVTWLVISVSSGSHVMSGPSTIVTKACRNVWIWFVFEKSTSRHTVTLLPVHEVINDCMNKVSFLMIMFLLPADLKLSLTVFKVLRSFLVALSDPGASGRVHQGLSFTDGVFDIKTGNVSIFWSYVAMATYTVMTINHV